MLVLPAHRFSSSGWRSVRLWRRISYHEQLTGLSGLAAADARLIRSPLPGRPIDDKAASTALPLVRLPICATLERCLVAPRLEIRDGVGWYHAA
jgi:hypothetical protein